MTGERKQVPSARTRTLMRAAAERMLAEEQELVAESFAALQSKLPPIMREDPVLREGGRRANETNTLQWLTATVNAPGEPVAPYLGGDALNFARDLARRGIDSYDLISWRESVNVAWGRWTAICLDLTSEPTELVELLSFSHASMNTFADDTMRAVREAVAKERDELTSERTRQRFDLAALLISGAPVSLERAERELGQALSGRLVGLVVWARSHETTDQIEPAIDRLMRAARCHTRTTVAADSSTSWTWLPTAVAPEPAQVVDILDEQPDVNVAIGRPHAGLVGFRQTHLEALATQRVLAALNSPRRISKFDDVRLASVLVVGTPQLDTFIHDTLGDLEHADPVIRQTVLAFVRERFNSARTAERLFTHRNTIDRRLRRADELLPSPLADYPVEIAAALTVVQLRSDPI
ncbi:CdaR family transcriptional regulator [Streptomyces canus]|uniref:PucR family transcriptional regulator n=1 Tax=Streptomyces canus TaxID=58343 RepID=UPI00131A17EA|nr:helix-turn-helix domain-containing protein [Streptomyces canus]